MDSISGDGLKFIKDVYKISMIMKKKGYYTEHADIHKTFGFYGFIVLIIVILLIFLIIWYYRNRK